MIFIDSNIPMYVAGREHPHRAPAIRFLDAVRSGDMQACTSTEVLQEILYRYLALDRPAIGFEVYDLFADICPVVLPVALADTDRARRLLEEAAGLPVRDAIHAAVMLNNSIHRIATFDRHFDRVRGIERVALS